MAERMQELPVGYEQIRSLMIEAIKQLNEPTQIPNLIESAARIAVTRQLVPDPNGPSTDPHKRYIAHERDVARMQDIVWDLIIEGIVRPGRGEDVGNSDLPHLHVTEYGRDQVSHGSASPHDPDGFLNSLRGAIPQLDPVIVTYLNECLHTFRIGCPLSCAVTLGCASERALLLLIDAYSAALPAKRSAEFRRKTEGRFIKTQYDVFNKMLEGQLRAQLPVELADGLTNILLGVFEMVRRERNDAGHPTGKTPSRDVLFASIRVFSGYLKRVYDLIEWLEAHSPGKLP